MRIRLVKSFLFTLPFLASPSWAESVPQPEQPTNAQREAPALSKRAPTPAQSPGESFGSVYGTGNLARPRRMMPPAGAAAPHSLLLRPEEMQKAQDQRTQPPAAPDAYAAYSNNDPLLALFDKQKAKPGLEPALLVLLAWNHVALDMTSIDHTTAGRTVTVAGAPKPLPVFEPTYGEQFGPPRSARAMAMVHLAMFEAANTVDHRFASYSPPGGSQDLRSSILAAVNGPTPPDAQSASLAAAITQAARDTLVALYPKKTTLIDTSLLRISILVAAQEAVQGASQAEARIALGKAIGAAAAASVIVARQNDHSNEVDDPARCQPSVPGQPPETVLPPPLCWERYFPDSVPPPPGPLTWTIDPISRQSLQLGALWKDVTPFVLAPHQFTPDSGITLPSGTRPLPSVTDPGFLASLNNGAYGPLIENPHGGGKIASRYGVRRFGGWGAPPGTPVVFPPGQGPRALTPTDRKPAETTEGNFWGYDATALLCAPPRLYNMLATSFYLQHVRPASTGHAAVNAARYLALINLALGDASVAGWDGKYTYNIARPVTYLRDHAPDPAHPDDASWTPLGQVGSNGGAPNVTPPFPAYPSGHAVFGGAIFTMIGRALGLDPASKATRFNFVSDEYNGRTFGYDGKLRPFKSLHYVSLEAADWANAESRVFLGVHWQRDADDGRALGKAIAEAIVAGTLMPLPGS